MLFMLLRLDRAQCRTLIDTEDCNGAIILHKRLKRLHVSQVKKPFPNQKIIP